MDNQTYRASQQSIHTAMLKALMIGISVSAFIVMMSGGNRHIQGTGMSSTGKWILFLVLALFFCMLSFFTDSSMRTYQVEVGEKVLSRTGYKSCFVYDIKWVDIDYIVFGQVLDRYNRWDIWYEGMEIRHKSEFGSPDKSVYKLEHIEDVGRFINHVKAVCDLHDIQYSDIRSEGVIPYKEG